jgi:hypothetical protein
MVLASGCGAKTLIRIGAGNLKSLVVFIVLGVTAYMSMRGMLGVFRVNTLDKAGDSTYPEDRILPATCSAPAGIAIRTPHWPFSLAVLLIGGGIDSPSACSSRDFWTPDNLLGGCRNRIGAIVVAGMVRQRSPRAISPNTRILCKRLFFVTNSARMESLTFVAPQAYYT